MSWTRTNPNQLANPKFELSRVEFQGVDFGLSWVSHQLSFKIRVESSWVWLRLSPTPKLKVVDIIGNQKHDSLFLLVTEFLELNKFPNH